MNEYPATLQNRQLLLLLNLLIALAAILCAVFIFLLVANYGTVRLDSIPNDAAIRINGHPVASRKLKLRPGDYQVVISSPATTPYQGTLHVTRLRSLSYHPPLQPRDPNAIASSVIGAEAGSSKAPQLSQVRWFDNNTWLVGLLTSGPTELALQYQSPQKHWTVGFYGAGGYPHDPAKLPAEVAAYVNQLEAEHAR